MEEIKIYRNYPKIDIILILISIFWVLISIYLIIEGIDSVKLWICVLLLGGGSLFILFMQYGIWKRKKDNYPAFIIDDEGVIGPFGKIGFEYVDSFIEKELGDNIPIIEIQPINGFVFRDSFKDINFPWWAFSEKKIQKLLKETDIQACLFVANIELAPYEFCNLLNERLRLFRERQID